MLKKKTLKSNFPSKKSFKRGHVHQKNEKKTSTVVAFFGVTFLWDYFQPTTTIPGSCFSMFRVSTNLAQLLVAFGSCMFRRSVRTPQVFWVEMVPTKYVSQKKKYEIWVYIYMHICIYIYIYIFIYAYVAFRMDENPVSNETVKMG